MLKKMILATLISGFSVNTYAKTINLMLIGVSGEGKSTTVNGLYNLMTGTKGPESLYVIEQKLDRGRYGDRRQAINVEEYKGTSSERKGSDHQSQTTRVTKYCLHSPLDPTQELCIFDTPGFGDSVYKSDDPALKEIIDCLENNSVHAIGLVMNAATTNRSEDRISAINNTKDKMVNILALENMENNFILLGTHCEGRGGAEAAANFLVEKKWGEWAKDSSRIYSFGFEPLRFLHSSPLEGIDQFIWNRNEREFRRLMENLQNYHEVDSEILSNLKKLRARMQEESTAFGKLLREGQPGTARRLRQSFRMISAKKKQVDAQKACEIFVANGQMEKKMFGLLDSETPVVCQHLKGPTEMTYNSLDSKNAEDYKSEYDQELQEIITNKVPEHFRDREAEMLMNDFGDANSMLLRHSKYLRDSARYQEYQKKKKARETKLEASVKQHEKEAGAAESRVRQIDSDLEKNRLSYEDESAYNDYRRYQEKANTARRQAVMASSMAGGNQDEKESFKKFVRLTKEYGDLVNQIKPSEDVLKKKERYDTLERERRLREKEYEEAKSRHSSLQVQLFASDMTSDIFAPPPREQDKLTAKQIADYSGICENTKKELRKKHPEYFGSLLRSSDFFETDYLERYYRDKEAAQTCGCGVSFKRHYVMDRSPEDSKVFAEKVKVLRSELDSLTEERDKLQREMNELRDNYHHHMENFCSLDTEYREISRAFPGNRTYCARVIQGQLDAGNIREYTAEDLLESSEKMQEYLEQIVARWDMDPDLVRE